jgi:hypothetical protein
VGSSGGSGDGEGTTPESRLRTGSAQSQLRLQLRLLPPPLRSGLCPAGLQFMALAAEGRGAEGRNRRSAPAANLPARLARGSEAPGTTNCLAEMTRGLLPPKISLRSPRVRGVRATSPPPARRRAVPPPGPTAGARGACACQHEAGAQGLSDRHSGAGCSQPCLPALGSARAHRRAVSACAAAADSASRAACLGSVSQVRAASHGTRR